MPEQHGAASAPEPRQRSVWLTPAGISAIAGVAGVIIVVVGWFVAGGFRDADGAAPSDAEAASATETTLFVYGSAMPGQWGYSSIERYVESSRRDEVQGLLFDSGRGYPMAVFDIGSSIPGFLLELDEATAPEAMRALTKLEGGMFHPVEVRTGTGATAIAFEWIGSTEGYPRIDAWQQELAGDFGTSYLLTDFFEDECFDPSATPQQGVLVNCSAPHTFRVFRVLEAPGLEGEAFPGHQSLVGFAETHCAAAFGDDLARQPADDEIMWGLPSQSGWADGARAITCSMRSSG